VLRLTKVPAVLIEGGFLTERGESKLISNKDWRAKLAGAIGIGIETYQALPVKKQPPMIVADYRRQAKSAPVDRSIPEATVKEVDASDPGIPEATVKEADASLLELVGRSALLAPPQPQMPTPAPTASLQSAPIVP
jgi:N-acetylmuramoyl-L-alanine amidase-like protein